MLLSQMLLILTLITNTKSGGGGKCLLASDHAFEPEYGLRVVDDVTPNNRTGSAHQQRQVTVVKTNQGLKDVTYKTTRI